MIRRFTIIVAALVVMSGNVAAQKKFAHKPLKTVKAEATNKKKTVNTPAKVRKAPASLYMPLHEDVFYYEDGEWQDGGNTDYTYDARGNVLTSNYVVEGQTTLTEYAYNDDDKWVSMTETVSYGGELDASNRRTRAYDAIVKDLIVESMQYNLVDNDWALVNMGYTWKRDVARDDKGRVTGVSYKTYYMDNFEEISRTTVTYNQDGLADTWKLEELTYDGTGESWQEAYTLSDMQWYTTDGQIVAKDVDEFFTGNNRLKSAVVTEPDYGETGTINATYEENGNYRYEFNYNDEPLSRDVATYTYTDDNGSVIETLEYYEDMNGDGVLTADELMESTKVVVTYDDKGELIAEEYYFDDEFDSGVKYDVDYGEYSYPVEWIMSEYDYDMGEYVPFMKLVRSNFVDVANTSSINGMAVSSGNDTQEIYNIQGVKMGMQVDALPAGLYIVKDNGKTSKLLKK